MDPNLVNLKYNDLRKVAKDLGICNFGEYSGLPTKEAILDGIKEYYENGGKPVIKKKKVKKQKEITTDEVAQQPTQRITRRTTHMESEILADLQKSDEKEQEPEVVIKKKRVVKKTNKDDKTIEESIQQQDKIQQKATKNKVKKTEPTPIEVVMSSESVNQTEIKNDKKIKKSKKSPKKSKKTNKKVEPEPIEIETNDITCDTNTNQSDEFQLKLDDEDEQEQEVVNNLSIMTNDDDQTATTSKPMNVTVDILNRTFDKTEQDTNRPHNRLVSANIKPFYIENNDNIVTNNQTTSESSVSCGSFYNHIQPVEEVKPRARIVRPKQKATIAVEVGQEVVTQKVVVDIVQREAGPRIVKPVEADDSKRKNTDKAKTLKKIKDVKSTKAPDFKAIHEKNFEKLESVSEGQERLNQRHKQLTKSPTQQMSKLTISTNKLTSSITTSDLNKAESNTPKMNKTKSHVSVTNSLQIQIQAEKTTNIPKLLVNNKPAHIEKTPNANDKRHQNGHKTPTSLIKPKTSLMLSTKKPAFTFKYENQNMEPINFSSGCQFNAGGTNLLATSSFNRRKSFDLNASLARPLNYKRHVGKLKPIDPVGKPNGLLKPITNMNDTITTKPVALKSADNKRNLLKQRELFKQTKQTNNDVQDNDENMSASKVPIENEKIKVKRNKKFDEKRKLNEQTSGV